MVVAREAVLRIEARSDAVIDVRDPDDSGSGGMADENESGTGTGGGGAGRRAVYNGEFGRGAGEGVGDPVSLCCDGR
jgi:hypothetical protein